MKRITLSNRSDMDDYSITVKDEDLTRTFDAVMGALRDSGLTLNQAEDDEVYEVRGKMWKCSYLYWETVEPEILVDTIIDHDEHGVHIQFNTE